MWYNVVMDEKLKIGTTLWVGNRKLTVTGDNGNAYRVFVRDGTSMYNDWLPYEEAQWHVAKQ